jgi:hypothetical protein
LTHLAEVIFCILVEMDRSLELGSYVVVQIEVIVGNVVALIVVAGNVVALIVVVRWVVVGKGSVIADWIVVHIWRIVVHGIVVVGWHVVRLIVVEVSLEVVRYCRIVALEDRVAFDWLLSTIFDDSGLVGSLIKVAGISGFASGSLPVDLTGREDRLLLEESEETAIVVAHHF